jgi:uncharacterized protein YjbI with pentapeptide repeats
MIRSNLVGTKGHGTNLDGAKLYYSRPGCADFQDATFRGADITRTIFRKANVARADFTGATGQANFENANREGVIE